MHPLSRHRRDLCHPETAVCVELSSMDANRAQTSSDSPSDEQPTAEMMRLRAHLEAQPHSALVRRLVEFAGASPELATELLDEAGGEVQVKSGDDALAPRTDQGTGVGLMAEAVRVDLEGVVALLEGGHHADALAACEALLDQSADTLAQTDDADAGLTRILRELEAVHLQACSSVPPEPCALAERLFEWAMRSGGHLFQEAARRYSAVLGEQGHARYRELADRRWQGIAPIRPGEEPVTADQQRRVITRIMELLAADSGSSEDLVAVLSRDLSSPTAFHRIAQVLP